MATGYEIDFTDQNTLRTFDLREYTTNGPKNPQNSTLDDKATSAASSLLLYGKGSPNYGERIQENMLHMLEHFSGDIEPVYPISGQIWFDNSAAPSQLRIFDASRYQLLNDPDNPSSSSWIAINPGSPTEEAELLARYAGGSQCRITQPSTGDQEEHIVGTAAVVRGSGVVAFQILPAPSVSYPAGGWYVGGWEMVMQNNAPLREALDASGWSVINLPDPTNNQDVATKNYVDVEISTAISSNNQMDELTDVTITGPTDDNILIYDSTMFGGTGGWKNSIGSNIFLRTAGGTLTGNLIMSGNFIQGLPLPIFDQDAATKLYVDDLFTSPPFGFADLTDVVFSSLTIDDIVVYNGATWENKTPATFAAENNYVTVSGATFTGGIYLASNPTISNQAATKDYVDTEISYAISASGDGVTDSVTFDPVSKNLTLTRTNSLSDLVTNMAGAGGDTTSITHTIANPNYSWEIPEGSVGLLWEYTSYKDTAYPTVTTQSLFRSLNRMIGKLGSPKSRLVFASNGGSIVNLSDDAVPIPGQANPALPNGGPSFTAASNFLSVYVNGVKQISSEHGYREVLATQSGSPYNDWDLWHGTETGLNPALNYTFNITVAGEAPAVVTISGSDAFRMGHLVDAINEFADNNYFNPAGSPLPVSNPSYGFGCSLHEGAIFFVSAFPGTHNTFSSGITLTDGATNPLFASIIGNPGTTGGITIEPLASGETNPYPPTDYAYKEVGQPGQSCHQFEFITIPPVGAVVEVIIDPDMYTD